MKALFPLLLFSLIQFHVSALTHGKPRHDTTICLVMNGMINNSPENPGQSFRIELLLNNTVVDVLILKGNKKKFSFSLQKNRHYVIRMSAEGFVTKNICIHTTVPHGHQQKSEFRFETRLATAKAGQPEDPETRDLPVASIYYSSRKQGFYYHKAFSAYYQKQLCKSYLENNPENR